MKPEELRLSKALLPLAPPDHTWTGRFIRDLANRADNFGHYRISAKQRYWLCHLAFRYRKHLTGQQLADAQLILQEGEIEHSEPGKVDELRRHLNAYADAVSRQIDLFGIPAESTRPAYP